MPSSTARHGAAPAAGARDSVAGFPFLTLEAAAGAAVDHSKSMWILAALFVAALLIDGYMRTRFE
jgi:hypothetical protein